MLEMRIVLIAAAAEAFSWPLLGPTLRLGGDEAFAELVAPVAVAVNLSYVATHGSYYDPSAANATPGPAWTKAALEADPADGGMRALAWLHADGARAMASLDGSLDDGLLLGRAIDDAMATMAVDDEAVEASAARIQAHWHGSQTRRELEELRELEHEAMQWGGGAC